jgi:hypothetical protein
MRGLPLGIVNKKTISKMTLAAEPCSYLNQQMPSLYKDRAAFLTKGLVEAHMRASNP